VSVKVSRFDDAGGSHESNRIQRFAVERFDRFTQTSAGALVVDAAFTRTGVFEYMNSDGSIRREWRPPEEVLKIDSVNTLLDAPVTVLHPPDLINSANWREYAVGHQRGTLDTQRDKEGGKIVGQLVISDRPAIEQALSGILVEISCGYQCILDMVPGITDTGERYDAIQRNIIYNHISIGPENWGRQGSEIAMRLDSAGNQLPPKRDEEKKETNMKIKLTRLDGTVIEVEAGSAEHLLEQGKIDAARDAELARLRSDGAAATARADGLTAENTRLKSELAEAPSKIQAQTAARSALESKAAIVLGPEFKFVHTDGKAMTDNEIRVAVIKKCDPEFRADGKVDAYLEASFDFHTRSDANPERDHQARGFERPPTERKDAQGFRLDANDPDPDAARDHMIQRRQDMWKPKPQAGAR
jgi:hypothetical protein